jgi:hypothetical protein
MRSQSKRWPHMDLAPPAVIRDFLSDVYQGRLPEMVGVTGEAPPSLHKRVLNLFSADG